MVDVTLEYMGNGTTSASTKTFNFEGFVSMTFNVTAEEFDIYGTESGDQDAYVYSYISEIRMELELKTTNNNAADSDHAAYKADELVRWLKQHPQQMYRLKVMYSKLGGYLQYDGRISSLIADLKAAIMLNKSEVSFSFYEDDVGD